MSFWNNFCTIVKIIYTYYYDITKYQICLIMYYVNHGRESRSWYTVYLVMVPT